MRQYTISLSISEDYAAIKILNGIFGRQPVAKYKNPLDKQLYLVFTMDESCPWDVIYEYEQAKATAELTGTITDDRIIGQFVDSRVRQRIKDIKELTDESFQDAVR